MVLLDLGLPDMDGRDVCRLLRERSATPIIMLTARSEEFDPVLGLELGADDYVTKPVNLRELVARSGRLHGGPRTVPAATIRSSWYTDDRSDGSGSADSPRTHRPTRGGVDRQGVRSARVPRHDVGAVHSGPRSSRRSGMPIGTDRPRRSTPTSPRCARSSAIRGGSRPFAASGFAWNLPS